MVENTAQNTVSGIGFFMVQNSCSDEICPRIWGFVHGAIAVHVVEHPYKLNFFSKLGGELDESHHLRVAPIVFVVETS